MKIKKIINYQFFVVMMISFCLVLPGPEITRGEDIPAPADVAAGKAKLPTIEQLTGGKVKKGDLIDKSNIDLIEDYCCEGTLEAINQGMKMIMGTNPEPYSLSPKNYFEITEKNKGKAILEPDGSVWLEKRGVPWPGGIPFPEPKNAMEVMASVNYGQGADDSIDIGNFRFVNKKGKIYKVVGVEGYIVFTNLRTVLPPLGTWPGYEDQMYRRLDPLTYPMEVKGQGQFGIRYYNDAERYDTGFMYFPAFKRTMRISTTVYQDSIGGGDFTFGDARGLAEPFSTWNFKIIRMRYIMTPEFKAPFEYCVKGKPVQQLIFDEGKKWPRMGWCVNQMYEIEGIPKHKHIYGKKIMYIATTPYAQVQGQVAMMDIYDKQMKLWKYYCPHNGDYISEWQSALPWGIFIADLQAQHITQLWFNLEINTGIKPNEMSFKGLLKMGR